MSKVSFSCTMCGRCCTSLRLPVSVGEAMAWLRDGGDVQVFCEAIPWPDEPPADNLLAHYKRRRSFAGSSGALPLRVIVSLMASFDGPCPNLQPDKRCGIYERRPSVCRIYPAEVNPFITLEPASKLCPPEAWDDSHPALLEDGEWTDPEVAQASQRMRDADFRDAVVKARLCAMLGISVAGLSNEGLAIHSPAQAPLIAALEAALAGDENTDADAVRMPWSLASNRTQTLATLQSIGALSTPSADMSSGSTYLGFFAATVA